MTTVVFKNLGEIKVEKISDKIIAQIKGLISAGELKPGERLPSERKLAEIFGVGRMHVRDAIQKLEFYGIVKTLPQSGTVVRGLGVVAFEGLLTNLLELSDADINSTLEARKLIETHTVRLAAERGTEEDFERIQEALLAYEEKVKLGESGAEEDRLFHQRIAKASKNSTLYALQSIFLQEVKKLNEHKKPVTQHQVKNILNEYFVILDHIKNRRPNEAVEALEGHLDDTKV